MDYIVQKSPYLAIALFSLFALIKYGVTPLYKLVSEKKKEGPCSNLEIFMALTEQQNKMILDKLDKMEIYRKEEMAEIKENQKEIFNRLKKNEKIVYALAVMQKVDIVVDDDTRS